ncbi:MAG: hypothetical protein ACR2NZ_20845 [Rubripirellula sp.]
MATGNPIAAATVLERYPDKWHIIVQLCRVDEDFRELCDHYAECLTVVTHLDADTNGDAVRLREYRVLIRELEVEIETLTTKTQRDLPTASRHEDGDNS